MNEEYVIKKRKDGSIITVRDVQDSLLDILIDVDKICRENNIKYILEGGTALGAIRHKGFIPWDDDLDIAMMRDEYNKFIKVLEKKLPNKYVFHCYDKNKKYNVTIPAMKIRKKNTYIKEVNALLENKCKDCDGIFLDVFVFDHVNKHKIFDVPFRIINGLLMVIINILENFKINPVPLKSLYVGIAKFYGKINKKSKYIGFDLTWNFNSPFNVKIFKYDDIFPTKDVEFEHHMFPMPNNYDAFLCEDIGKEYMTLPPKNKRFAKHTLDINLNGPGPEDLD